jgi:hypothetical protein
MTAERTVTPRLVTTSPRDILPVGAISDVDKSKQSVDGVQLVRLSFPPKLDLEGARQCIIQAVSSIMSKAGQA